MTVDAIHIAAVVVLVLALWRLIEAWILNRNPDSKVGKAMAFVH